MTTGTPIWLAYIEKKRNQLINVLTEGKETCLEKDSPP